MDAEFQNCISDGPVSFQQAYGYGPYYGAYPQGTQVIYAANGQAYAAPYQYPYAGNSCPPCIHSLLLFI